MTMSQLGMYARGRRTALSPGRAGDRFRASGVAPFAISNEYDASYIQCQARMPKNQ